MDTTAINKPVYDALISIGVEEGKATKVAKSLVTRFDEFATKADTGAIKTEISELKGMLKVLVGFNIGVVILVLGLYAG